MTASPILFRERFPPTLDRLLAWVARKGSRGRGRQSAANLHPAWRDEDLFLHATWNAWVKSRRDTTIAVACLVTGAGFPNLAVSVTAAHERGARPLRRAGGDDERYDRPRRDDEHEGDEIGSSPVPA